MIECYIDELLSVYVYMVAECYRYGWLGWLNVTKVVI